MEDHEEHEQPAASETTGEGYPEEGQPGTGIDAHDHAEDSISPDHDAPKSTSKRDSEPSKATGNPKAAGG